MLTKVVCSDLRRALPLLRHNARLNGGLPTEAAAAVPGGGGGCGRVLCPGLHTLSEQVAEHEDHILTYLLAHYTLAYSLTIGIFTMPWRCSLGGGAEDHALPCFVLTIAH